MLGNLVKKVTGIGTTKMVLIVRTDLNMSRGKIASQCAHAAITLYDSAIKSNSVELKTWLRTGQPKIVLKVDGNDAENTLRTLYNEALKSGCNACLIRDAGKTQIESGTLTVLAVGPNSTEDVDKITRNLKLL